MLGQIQRFQSAINPEGFPGETFVTPVTFPSFLSKNRYTEFALYAQDNWSIGDRFKLNLGVRYDYFGPQRKSDQVRLELLLRRCGSRYHIREPAGDSGGGSHRPGLRQQ